MALHLRLEKCRGWTLRISNFRHRLHDRTRPRGSRSGRGEDSQRVGPPDLREDSRRSVQQRPQDLRKIFLPLFQHAFFLELSSS